MNNELDTKEILFLSSNKGELPVFLTYPSNLSEDLNIIFVMHGANRDPKKYLEPWLRLVTKHNLFVVAPLFEKKYFLTEDYQQGAVLNKNFQPNKVENQSCFIIEEIFNFLKKDYSLSSPTYNIYGHSAGAQFVHRMVLLYPNPKIKKAIAANAGWYTFPDFKIDYPHGLKNTGRTPKELISLAFQLDLTILIGGDDTQATGDPLLRRDETTDKQGICRFTRAMNFMREAYYQFGIHPIWRSFIIPNVAHENEKIVAWIEENYQEFFISK
jgi:poly(3-hydroxybutyrate) depolymerase